MWRSGPQGKGRPGSAIAGMAARGERVSDKPESDIAGRISASAEMLEAAVAELLRLIPESWQRTCRRRHGEPEPIL